MRAAAPVPGDAFRAKPRSTVKKSATQVLRRTRYLAPFLAGRQSSRTRTPATPTLCWAMAQHPAGRGNAPLASDAVGSDGQGSRPGGTP